MTFCDFIRKITCKNAISHPKPHADSPSHSPLRPAGFSPLHLHPCSTLPPHFRRTFSSTGTNDTRMNSVRERYSFVIQTLFIRYYTDETPAKVRPNSAASPATVGRKQKTRTAITTWRAGEESRPFPPSIDAQASHDPSANYPAPLIESDQSDSASVVLRQGKCQNTTAQPAARGKAGRERE